jgi:hypothetical protein
MRMNVIEYFRKVSKLEPSPEQTEILESLMNFDIKDQIICSGRGLGKSLLCAVFALYLADEYSTSIGKPITVLLISHQQEIYTKMDMFFRNCPELMARLRVRGDRYSMPLEQFEFTDNRSRVLMRMDTSRAIRGIHAHVVIMDEAQATEEDIILKDSLPCATEGIGKFILVGTPSERISYFVKTLVKAQKKKSKEYGAWHLSQYPSTSCWWLADKIERWKKEMDNETFTTEVLAELPAIETISPFKKGLKKCIQECSSDPLNLLGSYKILGLDLRVWDH